MRAVVTRVAQADVTIDGRVNGKIEKGFLILLGIAPEDTPELCRKLADKILGLRVFEDENGKMNLSLSDVGGQVLVVSQFTLPVTPFPFTSSFCRNARAAVSRLSTENLAPI